MSSGKQADEADTGYRMNTSAGVRHHGNCRNYENTKRGSACKKDDRRAGGCVREAPGEKHAVLAAISTPRCLHGQIAATSGSMAALQENAADCREYLGRHLHGEWGDLCEDDGLANKEALEEGLRLLSASGYRIEQKSGSSPRRTAASRRFCFRANTEKRRVLWRLTDTARDADVAGTRELAEGNVLRQLRMALEAAFHG